MRGLAVLLVLPVLAGCGTGKEGQDVKDALEAYLTAQQNVDAQALCDGVTPESRRMFAVVGKGLAGPRAGCPDALQDAGGSADTLPAGIEEAVKNADVDIEGGVARVKGSGDDRRIPLRKVDGEWLVDVANMPERGYGLRASAECTGTILRNQRRPLPRPTRRGVAADAERSAADAARLLRTIERVDPPQGQEDAHRRLVAALRQDARAWKRAARGIAGVQDPIDAYNGAAVAVGRRARRIDGDAVALGISCAGGVDTRRDAKSYRGAARRICRATQRRVRRISDAPGGAATAARQVARVTRTAAAALERIDTPRDLRRLHVASSRGLASSYGALPSLVGAGPDALERFGLRAMPGAIGFFRLGLPVCAEI